MQVSIGTPMNGPDTGIIQGTLEVEAANSAIARLLKAER